MSAPAPLGAVARVDERRLVVCGRPLAHLVDRDERGGALLEVVHGAIDSRGTRLYATLRPEAPGLAWEGRAALRLDGEPDRLVCCARFHCGHAAARTAWTGLLRALVYDWRRKSPARRACHG